MHSILLQAFAGVGGILAGLAILLASEAIAIIRDRRRFKREMRAIAAYEKQRDKEAREQWERHARYHAARVAENPFKNT